INSLHIGFDNLHVTKNASERIHDVTRIKISGCDFMQHWRKQNEILATDQHHLYVRATREAFLEMHRGVKPGKPATGNDYSSRFHAVTLNRNATRAIKILLMAAIVQSFSPIFFSSFSASKLFAPCRGAKPPATHQFPIYEMGSRRIWIAACGLADSAKNAM